VPYFSEFVSISVSREINP